MKLRKTFDTLPQRIFYNYKLCLSPFIAVKSDLVSEIEQKQLHDWSVSVINKLYEQPELMNINDEPDDCFELYVCNNRKPELSKSFRKSGELMNNFYRFLCYSTLNGNLDNNILTVNLDKKQMKEVKTALSFLPIVGIKSEVKDDFVVLSSDQYPDIFRTMRFLTTANAPDGQITGKTLFAFAMCIFDKNTDYLINMVEREMDIESGFFAPYFKQMVDAGYIFEHEYGWCAEGPYFFYKFSNAVSGFNIHFDMRKIHQIYFSLGSQIGVKSICEDFDNQSEHIKDFLLDRLTDCNNCMGCTKGGKNSKFAVEVTRNGIHHILCPNSIWIGFQVEYMNHDIMKKLIDFSALQAQYGKKVKRWF